MAATIAAAGEGLYLADGGWTVRDCIIRHNKASQANRVTSSTLGGGVYTEGGGRNYRLRVSSPCNNTGSNQPWMTGTLDLGGNVRIQAGTTDRGAYETTLDGMMIMIQ